MNTHNSNPGRRPSDNGFTILELMLAISILMIVCGVVLRGVLSLTETSTMVSNRTDMHNSVRNATELLTQEIGQAGRVAVPGLLTLSAGAGAGTNLLTVQSTVPGTGNVHTDGMFDGQRLVVGTGATQETVTISGVPASAQVTLGTNLVNSHPVNAPVQILGGFARGIVPPTDVDGSTDTKLKVFGDVHGTGRMVYVEYTCDYVNGRLLRIAMPFDQALPKPVPNVEHVLIDRIVGNPANLDGTPSPCFTYDTKVVNGTPYVVNVAITLTVETQNVDRNTGTRQTETKALLNVAPRNVFNVWQMAGLNITNRIQPVPPSIAALLPD